MKKEFDLSEKIVGNQSGMEIPKILESTKYLFVKDVKEFIKRLKEELKEANWNIEDIWDWDKPSAQEMVNELIDKLAGEKLR